jgi:hypothetical protein
MFRTCPDRPWGPPPCTMGTGSFPGVKGGRGVTLTSHPLLVPWSKGSAIPLLPLWAVRLVQSLSACTRVHFTFTFTAVSYYTFCIQCNVCLSCYVVRYIETFLCTHHCFYVPYQHVDVYLFSGRPPLHLVGSNIPIYKRNGTGIPGLVENQTGTF